MVFNTLFKGIQNSSLLKNKSTMTKVVSLEFFKEKEKKQQRQKFN